MASVKVLLAGECDGQLEQLYKRIQTVNAKSGPFKALFCVGRLFSAGELAACAGGGPLAPPWLLAVRSRSALAA